MDPVLPEYCVRCIFLKSSRAVESTVVCEIISNTLYLSYFICILWIRQAFICERNRCDALQEELNIRRVLHYPIPIHCYSNNLVCVCRDSQLVVMTGSAV